MSSRGFSLAALVSLLASCATPAPPPSSVEPSTLERHNVIKCSIIGMDGKLIRRFSGELCAFFPDGRVAVSQGDRLLMQGPGGETLWEKKLALNHQLNLDVSRTRLVTIAFDLRKYQGKKTRSDIVLLFGGDGKVLGSFALLDHTAEFEKRIDLGQRGFFAHHPIMIPGLGPSSREYSHVNSAYEIPDNAYAEVDPAFRAGGFIVNSLWLNLTFILDRELSHILWSRTYGQLNATQVHDVQVLPNGHLLLFVNKGYDKYSRLEEFDLGTGREVFHLPPRPDPEFLAPLQGGVQMLKNGHLLFNDSSQGYASEIKGDGTTVWQLMNDFYPIDGGPGPFQQIKRYNLSEFLSKNHFLGSLPGATPGFATVATSARPNPPKLDIKKESASVLRAQGTRLLGGRSGRPPTAEELREVEVVVNGYSAKVLSASDSEVRFALPSELPATAAPLNIRAYFGNVLRAKGKFGP